MSITLSDISLGTYVQLVSSASNIIDKAEKTINTEEIINMKLYDDMKPFTFQVFSIVHHSVGAIGALKTGEFGPPRMPDNLTFLDLKNIQIDQSSILSFSSLEKGIIHKSVLNNQQKNCLVFFEI